MTICWYSKLYESTVIIIYETEWIVTLTSSPVIININNNCSVSFDGVRDVEVTHWPVALHMRRTQTSLMCWSVMDSAAHDQKKWMERHRRRTGVSVACRWFIYADGTWILKFKSCKLVAFKEKKKASTQWMITSFPQRWIYIITNLQSWTAPSPLEKEEERKRTYTKPAPPVWFSPCTHE